jgi:superfamily II DNA or RNA helicase
MRVILSNEHLEVVDPTPDVLRFAEKSLTYTDKAKQFQLRRMANNPWQRNSQAYRDLEQRVDGKMYEYDTTLRMPQGFENLFREAFSSTPVEDVRRETGRKIVVPWVNKPHDLRDYQDDGVELMLAPTMFRGVINFATGLGKTLTATHLIQRYKRSALIVCPSDSVAQQFYEQCESAFGKQKVGFYGGGKKKVADITIGIAASITRNVDVFKSADFGIVIFDEIHHIAADTFYNIAQAVSSVGKVFGLTATDYRSDGKDIMITGGCGPVIMRRDIKWGVENGFLAEPYFMVREVETGGIDCGNDKLKNYKEHVLNNSIMKAQILSDAQKMIAAGKSVLVLVDEVEHGRELATQLGVPLAIGEDADSQDYVAQLNKGAVPALVGTDGRIGEGTDTRNVDVLILANFVASKGPVIQAVGRGLRKTPTKDKCLVLDYIPLGSSMLTRHARGRLAYYREITSRVKVVESAWPTFRDDQP